MQTRVTIENQESKPAPASTKTNKCVRGMELALAGIGAAAFDLYRTPSEKCAQMQSCGLWLYKITPEGAQGILWVAGGGDYALMNIYFASRCVSGVMDAIRSKKSFSGKMATILAILGFTTPKLVSQYFLVSGAEGSSPLDILLSVGGAAPGNLFAASMIAKNDLPKLISTMSNSFIFNCMRSKDEIDFIAHYKREQAKFNARLEANWLSVLRNLKTMQIDFTKNELDFLFDQQQNATPETYAKYGRRLFQAMAWIGTAAPVLVPIILNVQNSLKKFFPDSVATRIALTILIGAADTYLISKLMINGAGSVFDAGKNWVQGKPIDWLTLKLYPKLVALLVGASAITAGVSYALVETVYEKNYPGDWLYQNDKPDLKYAPIVGINIFHLVGLLHFCDMAIEALVKKPENQYLFKVKKEKEKLSGMTLEKFVEFSRNLKEGSDRYGIVNFEKLQLDSEGIEFTRIAMPAEEQKVSVQKKKSSWCSWFSGKKEVEGEAPLLDEEHSKKPKSMCVIC